MLTIPDLCSFSADYYLMMGTTNKVYPAHKTCTHYTSTAWHYHTKIKTTKQ